MKEIYVAITKLSPSFADRRAPLAAYVMQDYPNIESCEKELVSWYGKHTFDIYTLDNYIETHPVDHFTYEGHRCAVFKNNPDGQATISSIPSFVTRLIISRDINALNIISGFSQEKVALMNDTVAQFEKSFLFRKTFSGVTLQDVQFNPIDAFVEGYKKLDEYRNKSIIVAIYYDTPISVITSAEQKLYDINHISILVSNCTYLITIADTEIKLSMINTMEN